MKQHYFFIGRTNKRNEKHWEAVPILCFENNLPLRSVLEVYIFSKTEKNNEIDIIKINMLKKVQSYVCYVFFSKISQLLTINVLTKYTTLIFTSVSVMS